MKVLLINTVCGIRSTGRICVNIAKDFESKGDTVQIAYGREYVPELYSKYAVRIGTPLDYYLHALSSRLFDNSGFCSKRATDKFLKWADNYDPDLLWLHNLHGYYINVEALFKWIKSRPGMKVRWTMHDCWSFTGHCTNYSMVRCFKWKEVCENCCQKKAYPSCCLFDRSRSNFLKKKELFTGVNSMEIITPSIWLRDQIQDSFLSDYSVTVINNKIDNSIFRPVVSDFRDKYNLQNKIVVLAVASGWGPKKGLQDCISLNSLLDENYSMVVVGLTKKQIKKMPNSIICIERTNDIEELVKIYSAADVFINPTHEDNYPTVNLEARACGIPVITYDVGGSPESAGFSHVVSENDIIGLKKEIDRIAKSKYMMEV